MCVIINGQVVKVKLTFHFNVSVFQSYIYIYITIIIFTLSEQNRFSAMSGTIVPLVVYLHPVRIPPKDV